MLQFVVFGFVLTLCETVFSLECYTCDSQFNPDSCYDPFNSKYASPQYCTNKYYLHPQTYWSSYPIGFECVKEERFYMRNNMRHVRRSCQPKGYCSKLQESGQFEGYTLVKCDVCFGDLCNSSFRIKLSLVLNLIFFLIFYYCTDI